MAQSTQISSSFTTPEQSDFLMTVNFGYPGSKIREFLKTNYHQWNVKNWIEHATQQFCCKYKGMAFDFSYTPTHSLGLLQTMIVTFNGGDHSQNLIVDSKQNSENLYARISLKMPVNYGELYNIFGGGGNSFFFGGDFEAEKVDESNWYDVKFINITSLNFMDKLGRKQQVLPKA